MQGRIGLALAVLAVWGAAPSAVAETSGAAAGALVASEAEAAAQQQAAFQLWLEGFRARAIDQGIAEAVLDQALTGLALDQSILDRDRNQAEFTRQIWDYLDRAVSADRIANGKAALAKHGALLRQIEAKYGVEAEVVTAIWGLETAYGSYRGDLPVIASLATLGFDARRSAYFERELLEALKILQAGHVDPAEFKGSWAGASGHTQFMPSSFWRSAVDWTGDGRRNLWGEDPADALASAAAYLAKSGWQKGLPWGVEVTLPAGFPWDQTGERIKKPLSEWRALGVLSMAGGEAAPQVSGETMASVLIPAGHEGAAFLIFRNFQIIETYNTADAYVIAIGTLSDQLAGRQPIKGSWPRGDLALSGAQKQELQQLLLDRGHDPKGVDGIMGPNTIEAIRDYQKAVGLVPDGYASLRLIERLRQEAPAAPAGPAADKAAVETGSAEPGPAIGAAADLALGGASAAPDAADSGAAGGRAGPSAAAPPDAGPVAPAGREPRPPGQRSGG